MIHGSCDGDALFFSRDLSIEGDTEAVLALRNALDDAEIDLPAEIAAAFGLIDTLADRLARRVIPAISRVTGLTLTRIDGST
jgi:predicted lipid carrier protein YhbT